jgi:hypothetical protein
MATDREDAGAQRRHCEPADRRRGAQVSGYEAVGGRHPSDHHAGAVGGGHHPQDSYVCHVRASRGAPGHGTTTDGDVETCLPSHIRRSHRAEHPANPPERVPYDSVTRGA